MTQARLKCSLNILSITSSVHSGVDTYLSGNRSYEYESLHEYIEKTSKVVLGGDEDDGDHRLVLRRHRFFFGVGNNGLARIWAGRFRRIIDTRRIGKYN